MFSQFYTVHIRTTPPLHFILTLPSNTHLNIARGFPTNSPNFP
jgi:hypothetical protein